MTKKLIIKEVWLLDKNGNKKWRLTPLEEHEIPNKVEEENIRSGRGKIPFKDLIAGSLKEETMKRLEEQFGVNANIDKKSE